MSLTLLTYLFTRIPQYSYLIVRIWCKCNMWWLRDSHYQDLKSTLVNKYRCRLEVSFDADYRRKSSFQSKRGRIWGPERPDAAIWVIFQEAWEVFTYELFGDFGLNIYLTKEFLQTGLFSSRHFLKIKNLATFSLQTPGHLAHDCQSFCWLSIFAWVGNFRSQCQLN